MSDGILHVFLVDDDPFYRKQLEAVFSNESEFKVRSYASSNDCLANIDKNPDLILLDYNLDSVDNSAPNGLTTLRKIKSALPNTHVIMLSAQDKMDVAVNCMKNGASDYITKNETAFVKMKISVKNIFTKPASDKTVKHWEW